MIHHFVEHRHEVIVRRTKYDLRKAEHRAHIFEGLIIALDNLDEVIKLIRGRPTPTSPAKADEAVRALEIQAKAIFDMRLQRLTNLEVTKIRKEYEEVLKKIEYLKDPGQPKASG